MSTSYFSLFSLSERREAERTSLMKKSGDIRKLILSAFAHFFLARSTRD